MNLGVALNVFLAYLEGRPETAREFFRQPGARVSPQDLSKMTDRIAQAKNNISAEAVRNAIRMAYFETLKLDPPEGEDAVREAYLRGVQDVETVLAKVQGRFEDAEKKVGP